ncbi:T9SS type A sorting domain-containing protein [Polaribacter sp. BAL334]|uniref:T9SS type A sorting domain-containing protein n=1 Tax=Polaribacter sp. BAL334 TaxID=1708178 RepID=UPI0018D249CD|nr:T9SS type A sorting domain-containing protein [Polaribacter sp. BAL334]MBG7612125.1 T9SS type A sorting domain-containing protein [Polaribacter sp. BAL334]
MKLRLLFMFTAALFCFDLHAQIAPEDQIQNGDFSTGDTTNWFDKTTTNNAVSQSEVVLEFGGNYVYKKTVTTLGDFAYSIRIRQQDITAPANAKKVTFRAKGNGGEELFLTFGANPNKVSTTITLTNQWVDYELPLTNSDGGNAAGTVSNLDFQQRSVGVFYLDDVMWSDEAPVLSTAYAVFATAKVWLDSATDMLNVNGIEADAIEVYTISGQKIAAYNTPASAISLSGLSKGLYLVNIKAEQTSKVYKIVK